MVAMLQNTWKTLLLFIQNGHNTANLRLENHTAFLGLAALTSYYVFYSVTVRTQLHVSIIHNKVVCRESLTRLIYNVA